MGLIENMAKQKGAPAGVKLPVPTTAGDDQVIAAKTGEYVLPSAVVAAIGIDKLNAMVQQITGQAPGGQPAEMPGEGMPMAGKAPMMGHAMGGMVSKFSGTPLNADPLQDNRESLTKYGFSGGMGSDSVATEIDRASRGMPAADEVMDMGMDALEQKQTARQDAQARRRLGLADLSSLGVLGFSGGGLVSRMNGYADGGLVDDELRRRLARVAAEPVPAQPGTQGRPALVEGPGARARLGGFNPQATIPQPPAPSPRAAELRGYNPQSTIPSNATTNASPRAPDLRNFTPEPGRLQPGGTPPRISNIAPPPAAPRTVTPSRTIQELDMRTNGQTPRSGPAPTVGQRFAGAKQGFQDARAGRIAAEAAAPKQGLAARAKGAAGTVARGVAYTAPLAGFGDYRINDPGVDSSAGGVISNLAQGEGGKAWAGLKQGAVEAGLDSVSGIAKTADTLGGLVGADLGLQQRFDERVQADIGPMLKRGEVPPVAAAVPMTDEENQAEIARRRAALEPPPQAPAEPQAAPPQTIATAPQRIPRTGAAKTGRPLAQQATQPAAPSRTEPMEGAVEIIRGQNRSWAVPELGYQEVPDEVYRSGKIAEYAQAQSQNMLDRADPTAAELRTRLAEINAQGDNSIRVSRATDTGGAGRATSNALAQLALDQKRQEARLIAEAMAVPPEQRAGIIDRLNLLRSGGQAQDEYAAATRETLIDPTDPMGGTLKEPVIYNKRTGDTKQSGPQAKRAPYVDGQRLQGPQGRMYVVKNGVPVLEGE